MKFCLVYCWWGAGMVGKSKMYMWCEWQLVLAARCELSCSSLPGAVLLHMELSTWTLELPFSTATRSQEETFQESRSGCYQYSQDLDSKVPESHFCCLSKSVMRPALIQRERSEVVYTQEDRNCWGHVWDLTSTIWNMPVRSTLEMKCPWLCDPNLSWILN